MMDKPKPKGGDEEAGWRGIAIAFASIGLITILIVLGVVFDLPNIPRVPSDIVDKLDGIYKIALIFAGFTTFATVVWRGLIAARQADAQRDQVTWLAEQIAIHDSNNLAQLLEKASDLLGDEKPVRRMAGISILQSIAEDKNDRFSNAALDLLADYLERNGQDGLVGYESQYVISAIRAVAQRTSRRCRLFIEFNGSSRESAETRPVWASVWGVTGVSYKAGDFKDADFTNFFDPETTYTFDRCNFIDCDVDLSQDFFANCQFHNCRILKFSVSVLNKQSLWGCDFSGAEIFGGGRMEPLVDRDCWYDPQKPPITEGLNVVEGFEWSTVLAMGKPDRPTWMNLLGS